MTPVPIAIAPGDSISNGVNVTGTLLGIGVPTGFQPARLSFQLSPDSGATWFDLMNIDNTEVAYNVTPGCVHRITSESALDNKTWMKIRSGVRAGPVVQPDGVTFTLFVLS